MSSNWNIQSAIDLYDVDRWGNGYFSVNREGNVEAHPTQKPEEGVDIMAVVEAAKERRLSFPLMIRFQDLLRNRVETINKAFQSAIEEAKYSSVYRGVFPIKVNQLREVVEEIVDAGKPYHFGVEVGSKPELIAALAVHSDPESLIICNGYKDAPFIKMALLGEKLGKKVVLVVEKLEELHQILSIAKSFAIEPMIGVRVRLQSKGAGKWATSGGENAKFGLSTADLVEASHTLKAAGLSDCLKLIHFHVGSQVPDIGTIKHAVREAARFYAKLYKMGHALGYFDVGGGLGVDYDGSRTAFDSSANYTLEEYARDIVYNVADVLDSESVPHPVLVSESGRAIVAHHSVLVVEAFGSIEKEAETQLGSEPSGSDQKIVADMKEVYAALSSGTRMECLHDAQQIKETAQSMFDLGLLDLEAKAKVETLFWQIAKEIVRLFRHAEYVPDDVREMEIALADQYVCNFSVFQSLLDHWALGQLFPIMPVHKLHKRPKRNATLVDITCDSDGKVSKFIDLKDVKPMLSLHALRPNESYYIGIFLMGAYQDIMGDLHNLFGRVTEVHVFLDENEDSGYYIEQVIEGSMIGEVLALTQWDKSNLVRRVKKHVDTAIKSDRLKPSEGMRLLKRYEKALAGYTYLQFEEGAE